MEMIRVTAQWTGFVGAPGYSNFYFARGGGIIGDERQVAVRTYNALINLQDVLPTDVTLSIASEAAVIDSDTGEALEFLPLDVDDTFSGQGTGGYSGASGAVVNWRTSDVRFGRRIRGRTFLVPLAGSCYDGDGSLTTTALTDLRDFAAAMVGGDLDSELGVWSRPRNGAGGVFATVTGYSVPDLAAVLRSRRD